ncbi:MAG: hypothetical protein WCA38_02645 [Candidatus Acidiferrales bacterium]
MPIHLLLKIVCLSVVIVISILAWKGKLHIPGYVGMAFLTFGLGLLFGKLAGIKAVHGSNVAVALSVACYLCMSATVGSIIALAFYRERTLKFEKS